MQKITKERFEELSPSSSKWGTIFKEMEVGTGLLIPFDEWNVKSSPNVYAGNYKKRGIFEVKVRKTKEGWAIFRSV